MKQILAIMFFVAASIGVFAQEKPVVEKQNNKTELTKNQKQENNTPKATQSQIKQVPKATQNKANIQKAQQQRKQVKKVQMQQRKSAQTIQKQKAIQRRGNHK
jgi:hypothetical protein